MRGKGEVERRQGRGVWGEGKEGGWDREEEGGRCREKEGKVERGRDVCVKCML